MDTVGSVLQRKDQNVWSVAPDASVYDAIQTMAEKHIGALLVMSAGKLAGVISERDYARKVILQGRSSQNTQVREIMSSPVISVAPEDTVEECMRIMTDNRIRHLPVVVGEGVVGIVSIGDLVRCIIAVQKETIEHMNHYIAGAYPG